MAKQIKEIKGLYLKFNKELQELKSDESLSKYSHDYNYKLKLMMLFNEMGELINALINEVEILKDSNKWQNK
jgi:hypothetical protein